MAFLAELNGLGLHATDIGNACPESDTSERAAVIVGPEFGELQDHVLIVQNALCSLHSSGKMWHEKFADCMRHLGFFPSKAEPDVWMRRNGDICEHVAVCVDDLVFAVKNPEELLKALSNDPFNFKLKGSGLITFHLGMDFTRDENGVLVMAPRKHIKKLLANCERLLGRSPKVTGASLILKGDHPELDTSDLLGPEQVKICQSLVGALQWAVSIGRFDVMTAVVTLSAF